MTTCTIFLFYCLCQNLVHSVYQDEQFKRFSRCGNSSRLILTSGSIIGKSKIRCLESCLIDPMCVCANVCKGTSGKILCELSDDLIGNVDCNQYQQEAGCSHWKKRNQCQNGGILRESRCECKVGYRGKFCENYRPKNCQEIYNSSSTSSGKYVVYTQEKADPILIFCQFDQDSGYVFVSRHSAPFLTVIDFDNLFTDARNVIIRQRRKDTKQQDSVLQQLTIYAQYNLTVAMNNPSGFKAAANDKLKPYFFVGFLSPSAFLKGITLGYSANGVDYEYVTCDNSGHSYFAFYANPQNKLPQVSSNSSFSIGYKWEVGASLVPQPHMLSDEFFYFSEIYFSGCGAYCTSDNWYGITGASVGFHFDN